MTQTERKKWIMLENNPAVMNNLAEKLGLAPDTLQFYDIYSLDTASDPAFDPFGHIPRPCFALLAIIPLTPAWHASRVAEDALRPTPYPDSGTADEPVLWFEQRIGNACGSIGLLHCLINSPAARRHIVLGSELDDIRAKAAPLDMHDRAEMLHDHVGFEAAHKSVERLGDTQAYGEDDGPAGQHFVAFVKGDDGRFWELEGDRRGPLMRGQLEEGEDALSERALDMGIRRIIKMEAESGGGDLRFSCIALAGRGEKE